MRLRLDYLVKDLKATNDERRIYKHIQALGIEKDITTNTK